MMTTEKAGIKGKDTRNATCPKCKGRYRIFENYIGDQDVCPACTDLAFAPNRERAQAPERANAKSKLAEIEAAAAKKQDDDDTRIAKIAANVVKEMKGAKA